MDEIWLVMLIVGGVGAIAGYFLEQRRDEHKHDRDRDTDANVLDALQRITALESRVPERLASRLEQLETVDLIALAERLAALEARTPERLAARIELLEHQIEHEPDPVLADPHE